MPLRANFAQEKSQGEHSAAAPCKRIGQLGYKHRHTLPFRGINGSIAAEWDNHNVCRVVRCDEEGDPRVACECRGKLLSRSHRLALTLSDNNAPHRSEVRQPSSIIPLILHTRPIPKMKAPSSSPAAKRAVKATARIRAVSSALQRTALFPFRVYRKGTCQTKPWATAPEKVCTGRLKHLRQSPPPLPPLPLRRLRAAAPKPPPCLPIADRRTARPSRRAAKKAAARTA